jgi:hypothetical protein
MVRTVLILAGVVALAAQSAEAATSRHGARHAKRQCKIDIEPRAALIQYCTFGHGPGTIAFTLNRASESAPASKDAP